MGLVTIDFETYYAKEYTLSKLTTEEYVRDDRFEVIGVSVKVNDGPTDWFSGTMEGTRTFLNSLDYSDKAILCHNTAFDGAILGWHFNIKPKFWFDTLSMARPKHAVTVGGSLKNLVAHYKLGEKGTEVINALGKRRKDFTPSQLAAYGDYCINDTDITYELFKKLSGGFPVSELKVIDQTIRMYTEPVLELDRFKLEEHLAAEQARKQLLLDKFGGAEAAKKVLMSNKKFAALLTKLGAVVPTKVSPTTGKTTNAFAKTDKGMQELLTHPNAVVAAVAEARLGTKSTIEETRTQRLIDISKRGPLPIMLLYYGAHTGRFAGGGKINLQNLPARGNNAIRSAICAPAGCKLISCDSSQIEARMLAWLAGQDDLVQAFAAGRDVYKEFAATVYGVGVEHVTKAQRTVGKVCILALGYGMGWAKFMDTLRIMAGVTIDEPEARHIVGLYRSTYPMIKALWTRCDSVLKDMVSGQSGLLRDTLEYGPKGIVMPNGMKITYTALRIDDSDDGKFGRGFVYISDARVWRKHVANRVAGQDKEIKWTNIYGGKVVENIVQALARIVVSEQMTAIGEHYQVLLQVHDELIISVDANEVAAAQQVMERVMATQPPWAQGLPIACESAVGDNFGECK